MATYTVYRLTFKTQLHLGRASGPAQEGSLGLEKTETYIPADTLFSAICQTWATFYNTESLEAFLSRYKAESEALPFTLTSAFPFAADVSLFPKPLTFRGREDTPEKEKKKIKGLQFVSNNIFQGIISGNAPEFNQSQLINGEAVWMSPEEKDLFETSEDDDLTIWTTQTRPRVTIGSRNSGSEIWHVQTVQFNTECGLWFAARFDSNETQHKIETLLRVLGDTGIGGERNAGYGAFDFETASIEVPDAQNSNQFMTLSPICPQSADELEHLLKGGVAYTLTPSSAEKQVSSSASRARVAYTLTPSSGWVSTPGSVTRRKQINMFAEGSVLHTSDTQIGRLVDLRPDNSEQPVYRYGYAWQVGIKGVSE